MPRARIPCSGCEKLLIPGPGSLNRPTCRECRRKARQRICEQCNKPFEARSPIDRPKVPQRFCSNACRFVSQRLYEHPRAASKASTRARKAQRRLTWDGVTDQQIFGRDGWVCRIPGCGRPIQPGLRHPDPMSASVDHIVPLSRGGDDVAANKRAAHLVCNTRRGAQMHEDDVRIVTPELAPLGLLPSRKLTRVSARVREYCDICRTTEVKRHGDFCPGCRAEIRVVRRQQILECREQGMRWDDIAVQFGLSGSGAAHNAAYPEGSGLTHQRAESPGSSLWWTTVRSG